MSGRIEATRSLVAARDAGHSEEKPAAYASVDAFEADLMLVRSYLSTAGAVQACRTVLDPLIASVRAHGFHGFMMDVRDHADSHALAVADLMAAADLGEADVDRLHVTLLGGTRLP